MGVKYSFFGVVLQTIFIVNLMAFEGVAQYKSVKETYVNLELNEASIEEAFDQIQKQTNYTFFYDKKRLKNKPELNKTSGTYKVSDVLIEISKRAQLKFRQVNNNIAVTPFKNQKESVQELEVVLVDISVTGKVTDENGQGLPGASLVIKGTATGTTTDLEGNYKLSVPENATLVLSYVGYVTQEVLVGNRNVVDVQLEVDAESLDEVVVTALGIKREKESLGYTATKIDGDDFAMSQAPNVANALSGKAPGVFITNPNSLEGGSTRITIRGNTSLGGGNQPLIIVDGMPFSNSFSTTDVNGAGVGSSAVSNRDYGSALNQIEAMDIERMDILKGTAASALYGSRGANGVILITTKKGAGSKGMKVEYTLNTKVTKVYRHQEFQNEYGAGGPADILWSKPVLGTTMPTVKGHGTVPAVDANGNNYHSASYDLFSWYGSHMSWGPKFNDQMVTWWDGEQRPYSAQPDNMKQYYKDGSTISHNLSLMNSGEFGNFRASVTRKENKAIIDNSGFNTTNIYIGGNFNFNKQLRAEVFTSYNRKEQKNPPLLGQTNNSFTNMFYNLPRSYKGLEWENYKNADGSRNNQNGWPYDQNKYNGWDFHENEFMQYANQMRSSVKLFFDPTDWLSFSGTAGLDFTSDEREDQYGFTDAAGLVGGRYTHSLARIYSPNFDFLATAHKENLIEGLNGSISFGGQSWQTNRYQIKGNINRNSKSPYIYSFDNHETDPTVNDAKPDEERYEKRINSLFGFADLSYKSFIFLQVTARNDWSSTLPVANNNYFYPGASLSFVPSEIIDMGEVISFAKLRLAYATTGSDTDPYLVTPTFTPDAFGGIPTVSMQDGLPNLNLQSQRSKEFEIGTNVALFDGRLNIDLTYYNKNSFNQILSAPLPWSSGANSIKFNTGELELTGFEFDISATVMNKGDLRWDIGLVGSKFSNKLLGLTEGVDTYTVGGLWGTYGTEMRATVGQNFGAIYGWGIQKDSNGRPILNVFKDANGDVTGTVYKKTEELEIVGNATPKMMGGLNSSLSWKNFSFFTLIDFKLGGDVYCPQYGSALNGGLSPATLAERNGNGLPYTYPNGDTDNIGVIMDGVVLVEGTTDQYVENTNVVHAFYKYAGNGWNPNPQPDAVFENTWVKLRELSVSYRLPTAITSKVSFIQNVDVSVIGRDLLYFYDTMPDGINPEGLNGVGDAQYVIAGAIPVARSFALNLKVTF
ncbi:SusC/RagA family TonB-linked outer membrane protein [Reichenbachiella sp. MALMAid0571]|uniref:SusC/RagA family TonB-linked outer membrane protein n=1 Tax=Reichenbachiella sp. MALMAid0571 TaxID=3143939 RepID=UPI0032DEB70E